MVGWVGDGSSDVKGITSSSTSNQTWYLTNGSGHAGGNKGTDFVTDSSGNRVPAIGRNDYMDTENVLSVSYFVRDGESGLEMGSKAVHVQDFSDEAMMSNQVGYDLAIADFFAYFYPDLDGGSPVDTTRGRFDGLIRPVLGVSSVLNDWSVNAELNVGTDWVVTLPGQYLMVHRDKYWAHLESMRDDDPSNDIPCSSVNTPAPTPPATSPAADTACDFRDIPVVAAISLWDREEQQTIVVDPEDELVVSPSVGVDPVTPAIQLQYEVNVIKWFGPDTEGEDGVLGSQYAGFIDVGGLGNSGWASLAITSDPAKAPSAGGQGWRVCDQQIPYTLPGGGVVDWTVCRRRLSCDPEQPGSDGGLRVLEA